jgi:hypothetical protein
LIEAKHLDLAYAIELIAEAIDANFGKGYAKAHPELIAAQIQGAAIHKLADSISELNQ